MSHCKLFGTREGGRVWWMYPLLGIETSRDWYGAQINHDFKNVIGGRNSRVPPYSL